MKKEKSPEDCKTRNNLVEGEILSKPGDQVVEFSTSLIIAPGHRELVRFLYKCDSEVGSVCQLEGTVPDVGRLHLKRLRGLVGTMSIVDTSKFTLRGEKTVDGGCLYERLRILDSEQP